MHKLTTHTLNLHTQKKRDPAHMVACEGGGEWEVFFFFVQFTINLYYMFFSSLLINLFPKISFAYQFTFLLMICLFWKDYCSLPI